MNEGTFDYNNDNDLDLHSIFLPKDSLSTARSDRAIVIHGYGFEIVLDFKPEALHLYSKTFWTSLLLHKSQICSTEIISYFSLW